MPDEADVPRLVQQLLITRKIVDALYKADILHLDAMKREVFETGADRAASSSAATPTQRGPGRGEKAPAGKKPSAAAQERGS